MPTVFTMTSPTSAGELPSGISPVGGIVLDLLGVNGRRIVSQLPASGLFRGVFNTGQPASSRGNPGLIGVQTGFTPQVLDALGGGLSEVAVRLTVLDGDTAAGNFDFGDNELLLNGLSIGNFSDVATEETTETGAIVLSSNPNGGFRNELLDTGFFYSDDPTFLAAFYDTLTSGAIAFQLHDNDPFDNFFDFTQGVDAALLTTSLAPTVVEEPAPAEIPIAIPLRIESPATPTVSPAPAAAPAATLPLPAEPTIDTTTTLRVALFQATQANSAVLAAPALARREVIALLRVPIPTPSALVVAAITVLQSAGGGSSPEPTAPSPGPIQTAPIRETVAEVGRVGANVVGGAAALGEAVLGGLTAAADGAVAGLGLGLERLLTENRRGTERVQNPSETSEPPTSASPVAGSPQGRVGPVVRTTLVLLGALLVQRRWSGSRRLGGLRRRRPATANHY